MFYGKDGATYLKGHYGSGQLYLRGKSQKWEERPLPHEISAAVPDVGGETERNWHYLAEEFVKDIRGEAVEPYPTFKEGSQYQQLIDLIVPSQQACWRRSETDWGKAIVATSSSSGRNDHWLELIAKFRGSHCSMPFRHCWSNAGRREQA